MMRLYQWWINKYCQFKCSKLSKTVPWLQHGYMCTSWGQVTWLFLLDNTRSNHCDVTVRFVTLNSNCTLNKNRQQNIHYCSWETDKLIKMLWKEDILKMKIIFSPSGCGELPRALMRQQWPKLRNQFLFYHNETLSMMNKQILPI